MTRPYINPRTLSKLMGGASEIQEDARSPVLSHSTGEAGSWNLPTDPTGWDEFCQVIIAGSLFVAVGNGLVLLLGGWS